MPPPGPLPGIAQHSIIRCNVLCPDADALTWSRISSGLEGILHLKAGITSPLLGKELLNHEEPAMSQLLLSRIYPAKRPKQNGGIIYGVLSLPESMSFKPAPVPCFRPWASESRSAATVFRSAIRSLVT
jgi:hypothetical protein